MAPKFATPKKQIYDKGAQGQTWYCLECIESLYNGEGLMTTLPNKLDLTRLRKTKNGETRNADQVGVDQAAATQVSHKPRSKKKTSKAKSKSIKSTAKLCSICNTDLVGKNVVYCASDHCSGGGRFHEICGLRFSDGKDGEGRIPPASSTPFLISAGLWICPKCAIRLANSATPAKPIAKVCGICLSNMADRAVAPCGNDDCEHGFQYLHLRCAEQFPNGKDDKGKMSHRDGLLPLMMYEQSIGSAQSAPRPRKIRLQSTPSKSHLTAALF